MPCIPTALVITILYPGAEATIATELVNREVILLATKMPLVLAMKLPFSRLIDVWVWFRLSLCAVGVVQRTSEGTGYSTKLLRPYRP